METPQIYILLIELAFYAFVATFVAIVVLGHVLLAAAIIQCASDDLSRRATDMREIQRKRATSLHQVADPLNPILRSSALALSHYGLILRR